jgi:branched-chain amino acid transport system substrate-binding protein
MESCLTDRIPVTRAHLPGARRAWLKAALALSALGLARTAAGSPDPSLRVAVIEGFSGSFANAGEAVLRNLNWAIEQVNARGGVRLPGGALRLELLRLDSKGGVEEALSALRGAIDQGARIICQGNSSAVATALVEAIDKHNQRDPQRRVLFLNYSAVEPSLTNERCSFWHFRFDANADMRLRALVEVMRADRALQRLYLIGQDYSFGQQLARRAREMLASARPDIEIVGDELHALGRVKDFMPYAQKIRASGAQAVLTGNWGSDLTLLVKALREAGSTARLYTFYGNALGVPAAIGEAGVGRVLAVAEWHPNVGGAASDALHAAFRRRYPDPRDDYQHLRMQLMIELLAQAVEQAGVTEAAAVARALEGARLPSAAPSALDGAHDAFMRAADHQLQQPLYVSVMERVGTPGVRSDVEGSGYGFRTLRRFAPAELELAHQCRMTRPAPTAVSSSTPER